MSDITNDQDNVIEKTKIVYDREKNSKKKQPAFKPGKTPHTQLGHETLNANIPWPHIIEELQAHYTQEKLVNEAGITPANLQNILAENYSKLTFKIGAKLLMLHSRFYPEQY
jgi:hypothetical protein